jgi:quercetin dioxygenase-like cupin family protein
MEHTLIPNLEAEVTVPENGILSRTLHNDDRLKMVIFGFAPGQELSAHTAPMAASLHFLKGLATVTLGDATHEVGAGAFVYMPARLNHGILAKTEVVMMLEMYK